MKAKASRLGLVVALSLAGQVHGLPQNEVLRYSLNWPSGLSLGEVTWSTARPGDAPGSGWSSEFVLEAAVPAFPIRDVFRSTADRDLCSVKAEKEVRHGQKRTQEATSFDRAKRTAVRQTKGGGKTEVRTSGCPRDALTFLNLIRTELAHGRVPPPQTVYFGAPYELTLQYGGAAAVSIAGRNVPADRLLGSIKGPASQTRFELFLSSDAARTPLSARVPLPIGTLTLELVP
ncbi:MAG: DUF3108 domain-containing protein [Bryobacterales bacterium]|nr:DUF3108 domain-containing protein [Bryobacterales bacterium]